MLKMFSKIEVEVNVDNYTIEGLKIIQIIKPDWFLPNVNIKTKVFTDGITNKLVGYFNREIGIIVKIYGAKTELLIDRNLEIETIQFLHEKKCGPKLYAVFLNGIAYEFIRGTPVSQGDCTNPQIYPLISRELSKWHSFNGIETKNPIIWDKLLNSIKQGEKVWINRPDLRKKFEAIPFTLKWAEKAIEELQTIVLRLDEKEKIPVVFCHNDLLLGNIIYQKEPQNSVSFIDFEYSGPNYAPLDIANHFCEFAGINQVDYSKCPTTQFKIEWLKGYFESSQDNYENCSSKNIEKWLKWIDLFTPVAHLMWINFSVIQAAYSNIDFDYVEYLRIRLEEFNKSLERYKSQYI